jgi:CRISPR-associated protein Cas2
MAFARAVYRRGCTEIEGSGYRAMWLLAMFDLPVTTAEKRKEYAQFRKRLIALGFSMLQYSVYGRYFVSEESCRSKRERIKASLPPEGQVRLIALTDRQFAQMEVFIGKKARDAEDPPEQLALF